MTDNPQPPSQGVYPITGLPIPSLYANGIQVGLSNADVNVILLQDGQPIVKLNLSYTATKSFAKVLTETISQLEKYSQTTILTTDQVAERLQPLVPK